MRDDDDDNRRAEPPLNERDSSAEPHVRHDRLGRFVAGNPGGPGGQRRARGSREFRDLARDYAPTALKKLFQIALAGKGLPQVRACEVIIERAYGKTPVEPPAPKGGPLDTRFYGAARRAVDEAIAKAEAEDRAKAEANKPPEQN